VDLLTKEARHFEVRFASNPARKWGYRTALEITCPTTRFIDLLCEFDAELMHDNGRRIYPYKISYIEFSRDIPCSSEREAETAMDRIAETLNKRWLSTSGRYDAFEGKTRNKYADRGLFGERTWYYGGPTFEYVMYPRYSKINLKPCVHSEWCITGAAALLVKTGIKTLRDLAAFDIEAFFEANQVKHLAYERINHLKHGKWLLGWRKIKLTEVEIRMAEMQSYLFCRDHKIKTPADFVRVYKEIKAELKNRRGPKKDFEERILRMRPRDFLIRV